MEQQEETIGVYEKASRVLKGIVLVFYNEDPASMTTDSGPFLTRIPHTLHPLKSRIFRVFYDVSMKNPEFAILCFAFL